ncbi:MAG: glycosyltransferase [Solirubrobacteraceae bacterium]
MNDQHTDKSTKTLPLVGSVVIPAHNEASVITRCLDELFSGFAPDELDVVVVCNGCRDETATLARSSGHPVHVIELETASKAAALRAGDDAAAGFPRLYLDADVRLPGTSARLVLERLSAGAVAARPPLRYDSSHASAPVRSYYRARSRVPAVLKSLWGAGVYGLSEQGRQRFDVFPDVVADDLWLDRQFAVDEVAIVDCAPVVVAVPRRAGDLLLILRRTYKGKLENRPESGVDERARKITLATLGDLRRHAMGGPRAAVDAAMYAGFATVARVVLKLASPGVATLGGTGWERDDSSREG